MMPDRTNEAEPASRDKLQARVDEVEFWWHSIDLGQGVVTPGVKTPALIARELESLHLSALKGKTVLDVGAYDGYYSFASERLGADRVVALDAGQTSVRYCPCRAWQWG